MDRILVLPWRKVGINTLACTDRLISLCIIKCFKMTQKSSLHPGSPKASSFFPLQFMYCQLELHLELELLCTPCMLSSISRQMPMPEAFFPVHHMQSVAQGVAAAHLREWFTGVPQNYWSHGTSTVLRRMTLNFKVNKTFTICLISCLFCLL